MLWNVTLPQEHTPAGRATTLALFRRQGYHRGDTIPPAFRGTGLEMAGFLAATTGGRLPGVVFGVGGGEAIDLALKVARAHTGRPGIVSAVGGYHGHTGLALATGAGAMLFLQPAFPLPQHGVTDKHRSRWQGPAPCCAF